METDIFHIIFCLKLYHTRFLPSIIKSGNKKQQRRHYLSTARAVMFEKEEGKINSAVKKFCKQGSYLLLPKLS